MELSQNILLCVLFTISILWIAKGEEKVMNNFEFNKKISKEQVSKAVACAIKQRTSTGKYFDVDACMQEDSHKDEKLTMEKDLDECASSPCETGSTCQDKINGFSCRCAAGYSGMHCETDLDECASSPCEAGSTCQDKINGFSCRCAAGYTGLHCELDLDECASSPCEIGSTCEDKFNGYDCHCAAGYTGVHCESDPCDSTPCQNGGTCTYGDDGTYSCSCGTLVTGVNCETSEWISNGGRSYYVSTTYNYYAECRAICLGLCADLINLESAEETAFVATIARNIFWLSIYKSTPNVAPGTWVVNPDTTQQITYTNWYGTEPVSTSSRCAYAWNGYGYAWGAVSCTDERYFYICEK